MNLRSFFGTAAFFFLAAFASTLSAQTITSVDPPLGSHGDFVRIFGSGFAPNNQLPATLSIDFNGTTSTTSPHAIVGNTEIDITNVPAAATSGRIRIVFNGDVNNAVYSPSNFIIISTNAYVTNFTPLGGGGQSVTLTGVHMIGVTNVSFNGVRATAVTGLTANSITVTAPNNVTSGPLQTIGKFGASHDFNTSNNVFYAATNYFGTPKITSFTPTTARPGMNVVMTGVNFTASAGVMFGSTSASDFTISNNTTIRVAVPTNASTGKITVLPASIPISLASAISTGNFSMLPTIYGFSPNLGVPGTSVTVSGAGLNEKSPNPTVTIGAGTVTSFTTVSPNTLTFTVPATATSGPIIITTTNGSITSAQVFYLPANIISFTPIGGAPGTIVKITGNNFTNASAVTFNGIPATSFFVTNNTTIGAMVPSGVTSGPISVTTPFGTTNSASLFFAPPVITSFTPTHGLPGTSVMISGNNFTNATSVLFNGTPAASFVVTNNTTLSAVVPNNATTGPITVAAPGGTNQSANVFVIDTSDLSISVSSAPDPVFVGSNLVYTIIVTNNGPAAAQNVLVTNLMPASVVFDSATTSQGVLATNGNPILGDLGSIDNNSSATILLTVTPTAVGLITNRASVATSSIDTNLVNNAFVEVTTVWPLPFLSITNLMSNNLVRIAWPAPLSGFQLQFKPDLTEKTLWTNDTSPKVVLGTNVTVLETNIGTPKFFRLTN